MKTQPSGTLYKRIAFIRIVENFFTSNVMYYDIAWLQRCRILKFACV